MNEVRIAVIEGGDLLGILKRTPDEKGRVYLMQGKNPFWVIDDLNRDVSGILNLDHENMTWGGLSQWFTEEEISSLMDELRSSVTKVIE